MFCDFDSDAYERWRERKLAAIAAQYSSSKIVELANDRRLSQSAHIEISSSVASQGYALFRVKDNPEIFMASDLLQLCRQLGLHRLDRNRCAYKDGITRLQYDPRGERQHYIPYSKKGLNWHTDGYYNTGKHRIRAFALYCVRNAPVGGESLLYDHELVYLQLRDKNPQWVKALFRPDALTIPQNTIDKTNYRAAQSGPVFWIDKKSGGLQMRYTARNRSIQWNTDKTIRKAAAYIGELLQKERFIRRHKLKAGEGVISNNCLHGRKAFEDGVHGKKRLLYRARFFDRITEQWEPQTGNRPPC